MLDLLIFSNTFFSQNLKFLELSISRNHTGKSKEILLVYNLTLVSAKYEQDSVYCSQKNSWHDCV